MYNLQLILFSLFIIIDVLLFCQVLLWILKRGTEGRKMSLNLEGYLSLLTKILEWWKEKKQNAAKNKACIKVCHLLLSDRLRNTEQHVPGKTTKWNKTTLKSTMQLSDVETTYRKCEGLVLHSEWIMLGLRCVLEYGLDGGRTNTTGVWFLL